MKVYIVISRYYGDSSCKIMREGFKTKTEADEFCLSQSEYVKVDVFSSWVFNDYINDIEYSIYSVVVNS